MCTREKTKKLLDWLEKKSPAVITRCQCYTSTQHTTIHTTNLTVAREFVVGFGNTVVMYLHVSE